MAELLKQAAAGTAPAVGLIEGGEAFAEELDAAREIARARELWQGKRQRDAARRLLKLVRPAGWGAAELALGTRTGASAARWREDLVAEPLPPKHALVRLAQEKGVHLKRRAERRGRTIDTLDISALVAEELGPFKKRLARDAEVELKNRLGD